MRVCSLFPRSDAQADEWWLEPVLSLPQPTVSPEDAARAWRSTRRHAFDFT